METLNAMSNVLMGWWPVVVSAWAIITTILGLYSRNIKIQLTNMGDDLRAAIAKTENITTDLANYKLQIATTYMPAQDIKELVTDLKAFLIRIEDKVDGRKS